MYISVPLGTEGYSYNRVQLCS